MGIFYWQRFQNRGFETAVDFKTGPVFYWDLFSISPGY
jgi:hypothetical protein